MYSKQWAIDVSTLGDSDVTAYLQALFQALGGSSGPGNKSQLSAKLDMQAFDAIRFLTGAPDAWLTTPRQLFAEAAFAAALGGTAREAHARWAESARWAPTNPRAHAILATAVIDREFIEPFGLSLAGWDEALGMAQFMSRSARRTDSSSDRLRAVVGLSMLGFDDPMQFFTRR